MSKGVTLRRRELKRAVPKIKSAAITSVESLSRSRESRIGPFRYRQSFLPEVQGEAIGCFPLVLKRIKNRLSFCSGKVGIRFVEEERKARGLRYNGFPNCPIKTLCPRLTSLHISQSLSNLNFRY